MSLDEVKAKTSVSQYYLWMEFLEWERNSFDKVCYYLAQVAAEVRRSYVKKGVLVKIQDFIIEFIKKSPKKETENSFISDKQFFFALTGLTENSHNVRNRPRKFNSASKLRRKTIQRRPK